MATAMMEQPQEQQAYEGGAVTAGEEEEMEVSK